MSYVGPAAPTDRGADEITANPLPVQNYDLAVSNGEAGPVESDGHVRVLIPQFFFEVRLKHEQLTACSELFGQARAAFCFHPRHCRGPAELSSIVKSRSKHEGARDAGQRESEVA